MADQDRLTRLWREARRQFGETISREHHGHIISWTIRVSAGRGIVFGEATEPEMIIVGQTFTHTQHQTITLDALEHAALPVVEAVVHRISEDLAKAGDGA